MRNFKDLSRALASIAGGLKGIKDIIDTIEPGGGGSVVDYSSTEHEIGTWYDGSVLYEQTIKIAEVPDAQATKNLDISSIWDGTNICFIADAILINETSLSSITPNYYQSSSNVVRCFLKGENDTYQLRYQCYGNSGDLYVTLRYTKNS